MCLLAVAAVGGCRSAGPPAVVGPGAAWTSERPDSADVQAAFVDCREPVEPEAAAAFVYLAFSLDDAEVQRAGTRCAEALVSGRTAARGASRAERQVRRAVAVLVDGADGPPESGRAVLDAVGRLDPAPATPENERLTEHLTRLAVAHRLYALDDAPLGLDPRGEVYLRLGPPDGHRTIDFYSAKLLARLRDLQASVYNGFTVSPSEFADNELWYYAADEPFSFLFVDDGSGYRIGQVIDLIPGRFRTGIDGATGRGGAKADVLLEVLRTVFRQIGPFAPEYGEQFTTVDAFLSEMEGLRIRASVQASAEPGRRQPSTRSDFTALHAANADQSMGAVQSPAAVARLAMMEAVRIEQVLTLRRDRAAPTTRSQAFRPPLPLDARVARFLGPLGQTQVLAYWPEPAGREPERARTVVMGPDRAVVADVFLGEGARRLAWEGGSGGLGLAVQVERGGGTHVGYLDPVTPLLYGVDLEMSDLVPFLVDDVMDAGASLREGLGRDRVDPFPGGSLDGLRGVGLYAEVYLPVGGAEVFVTYSVRTRRAGGLFRRSDVSESTQQFYRESASRVLPVAFLIDQAAWDGADDVRLGIEVELLETGETIERTLDFRVE
ncbi:hypothetical protein [Rubrivirga sp.]|uniref:hypothetical protein n=1 Tax=Rubrivirga sp. TaxID=1885344 RepID=UPI003B51AD5E